MPQQEQQSKGAPKANLYELTGFQRVMLSCFPFCHTCCRSSLQQEEKAPWKSGGMTWQDRQATTTTVRAVSDQPMDHWTRGTNYLAILNTHIQGERKPLQEVLKSRCSYIFQGSKSEEIAHFRVVKAASVQWLITMLLLNHLLNSHTNLTYLQSSGTHSYSPLSRVDDWNQEPPIVSQDSHPCSRTDVQWLT